MLLGLKIVRQNAQGLYVNLLHYLYDCLIPIFFNLLTFFNYFISLCMFSYFTYCSLFNIVYKICWNDCCYVHWLSFNKIK